MPYDSPLTPPSVPAGDPPIALRTMTVGPDARRVVIVDHVIDSGALVAIHQDLRSRAFTFTNNDSDLTEFARHLVHHTHPDSWATDPVFATLIAAARAIMSEVGLDAERLERVYVNFSLFGDYQHAHTDGDCWTLLFFANACWHTDWGGELLIYDDADCSTAFAVAPKPGRVVLFDGDLTHRAGVPSKYCPEARLTVAVKFLRRPV